MHPTPRPTHAEWCSTSLPLAFQNAVLPALRICLFVRACARRRPRCRAAAASVRPLNSLWRTERVCVRVACGRQRKHRAAASLPPPHPSCFPAAIVCFFAFARVCVSAGTRSARRAAPSPFRFFSFPQGGAGLLPSVMHTHTHTHTLALHSCPLCFAFLFVFCSSARIGQGVARKWMNSVASAHPFPLQDARLSAFLPAQVACMRRCASMTSSAQVPACVCAAVSRSRLWSRRPLLSRVSSARCGLPADPRRFPVAVMTAREFATAERRPSPQLFSHPFLSSLFPLRIAIVLFFH